MSEPQARSPWGTIDRDSHIGPYLDDMRYRPLLSPLPWLHIHSAGRNVVGPYFPPEHRATLRRFFGVTHGSNTRIPTYFYIHDGQSMGPVLIETILDFMSLIFGKYFNKITFKMLITTQLAVLLHENMGNPIPHEQIATRLAILQPIFGDRMTSLIESVKMVANGPHFRLQFIDI